MRQRDFFSKNLSLSTEFDLYLLDHPEVAERIPNDALIVLLPGDDQELCSYNLKNAKKMKRPGQKVIYVKIKALEPPRSRLISPEVELAPAS